MIVTAITLARFMFYNLSAKTHMYIQKQNAL